VGGVIVGGVMMIGAGAAAVVGGAATGVDALKKGSSEGAIVVGFGLVVVCDTIVDGVVDVGRSKTSMGLEEEDLGDVSIGDIYTATLVACKSQRSMS
jgi:hypothetical protein